MANSKKPAKQPTKPRKGKEPKPEVPKDEGWNYEYGRRYVVGVQEGEDKNHYRDKDDYDNLAGAKEAADAWAVREGRQAMVLDRRDAQGIIYRTKHGEG